MNCKGHTIHFYIEKKDITKCYPLNPKLLKAIEKRGWILGDKLAEGSSADVFQVKDHDKVIILLNDTYPGVSERLKAARRFPKIFPVIYDVFSLDIPYSEDSEYIKLSGSFSDRTIQVIEKVDMTLETYLEKVTKTPPFIKDLRETLLEYLSTLYKNNITYSDMKLENIGVITKQMKPAYKLLDMQDIHLEKLAGFTPKDTVDKFFQYDVKVDIPPEESRVEVL